MSIKTQVKKVQIITTQITTYTSKYSTVLVWSNIKHEVKVLSECIIAVQIYYGRQLKVTQMRMYNTHKAICLYCIVGRYTITHVQSLAFSQNMKVESLLYPGRQIIGCESSNGCEPLWDRVDQPDIRRYIRVQFIHSYCS